MGATSHVTVIQDVNPVGVRIALTRETPAGIEVVMLGGPRRVEMIDHDSGASLGAEAWLRIDPDDARALYESLAEHYGHGAHDTRALRKDYDAERSRVDRLITHLIGGA